MAAFEVLLVFLAMLLTIVTERPEHLSTRGRLCLCSGRVLRLSPDSKASPSVSCKDKCTNESNAGVRHRPRTRRDIEDVLSEAEKCGYNKDVPGWNVTVKTVTFHEIKNSSDWYAEVTWRPFTESTQPWIGYYMLYFTGPPDFDSRKGTPCLMRLKNQTSVNITSSTVKKVIHLNVVALPVSLNTSEHFEQLKLNRYMPTTTPYPWRPPEVTLETLTENKITVTTYVSISIGILVGVALSVGLLAYFLCRKKRHSFPPEFKFHAFIIYNNEDSDWVSKELLQFLEEEQHIKCCIHYRDFAPGVPFLDSMAESVYNSFKIIAVFSSNFLRSNYTRHELDLAQYRLLNRRDDSLIIIRIDKTDPNNLPHALRKRNFIDYADTLERPFWKTKLLKFLKCDTKSGTIEQNHDNNNSTLEDSVLQDGYSQRRAGIDRLNSTTSNATEISIVTLNEERLI